MAKTKDRVRRPKGEGTVYADRGGFVAEVLLDGTRVRRRAATRDAAEKLREDIVASFARKGEAPTTMTVADWLTTWTARLRRRSDIRPATILGYESIVRDYLIPRLGRVRLLELRTSDIQRMIESLEDDGLRPNTVRNIRNCLGAALKKSVQLDYISANPVSATQVSGQRGTVGTIAVKYLSKDEIDDVLECVKHDAKLQLAVNLTITLGLRQQELLGLDWVDFDAEHQTLRIRQAVVRGYDGLTIGEPKTPRSRRTVRLPSYLASYLGFWQRPTGPMFDGKRSARWSATDLSRRWKAALLFWGHDPIEWRALRHIAVSRMIESGMDVVQVSRIVGHSTAATTLRFYADAAPVITAAEADARSLDPAFAKLLRDHQTPTITPQAIDPQQAEGPSSSV